MADYTNIQRVVIHKLISFQEWSEALEKLTEAKYRLDILRTATMQNIIPQMIYDHQMTKINDLIDQAVKLAGFYSIDDMKYFIEHFQNL